MIGNEYWFNEYIKFINDNKVIGDNIGYCEKHHIYPRKLYPELIKNKNNIVKLKAKDHLKAHLLLYKCLPNNKDIIYSLNMMVNRGKHNDSFDISDIEKYFDEYAEKYEEFRIKVSKIISETNSGRKMSSEQKQKLSEVNSNRVVVKDKDGNMFVASINDERYKSGELVYYRTGYKHKESTKQKMSENGIKGLHPFYDENSNVVYRKKCPKGYKKGLPKNFRDKISKSLSNTIHIFNPTTGESLRIQNNKEIPNGFIKMRKKVGGFVGFDKINESVRCYNIKTKKYGMVKRENIDFDTDIVSITASDGKDILNNDLFIVDNIIYTKANDIKEYLLKKFDVILPKYITDSNSKFSNYIQKNVDKEEISNMQKTKRDGRNKILLENLDRKLYDILNIKIVKLRDLVYNHNMKLYVSNEKRMKYGK